MNQWQLEGQVHGCARRSGPAGSSHISHSGGRGDHDTQACRRHADLEQFRCGPKAKGEAVRMTHPSRSTRGSTGPTKTKHAAQFRSPCPRQLHSPSQELCAHGSNPLLPLPPLQAAITTDRLMPSRTCPAKSPKGQRLGHKRFDALLQHCLPPDAPHMRARAMVSVSHGQRVQQATHPTPKGPAHCIRSCSACTLLSTLQHAAHSSLVVRPSSALHSQQAQQPAHVAHRLVRLKDSSGS